MHDYNKTFLWPVAPYSLILGDFPGFRASKEYIIFTIISYLGSPDDWRNCAYFEPLAFFSCMLFSAHSFNYGFSLYFPFKPSPSKQIYGLKLKTHQIGTNNNNAIFSTVPSDFLVLHHIEIYGLKLSVISYFQIINLC